MTTSVEIGRRAVMSVGGQAISAFDGLSTEAIVAEEYYDLAVREALSIYPWTFATTRKAVNRTTTTPASQWEAQYNFPTNPEVLAIQSVSVNDYPISYELEDDFILCDAAESDVVVVEYTYAANESQWPPYFVSFMVALLASYIAYPLTRQQEMEVQRKQDASGAFRAARYRDAMSQSARKVRLTRLTTQIR